MAQLGTHPISAPGWPGKARKDFALIDCDVLTIMSGRRKTSCPFYLALTKKYLSTKVSCFPALGTSMSHGV
jgi:hypothetical protein